jgi:hypothetical protein
MAAEDPENTMESIGIGTLAKRAGVSIDTVRYYERDGLLSPKLTDVERRIAELERVRNGLANLISVCRGHGRAADCPIPRALGDEELP